MNRWCLWSGIRSKITRCLFSMLPCLLVLLSCRFVMMWSCPLGLSSSLFCPVVLSTCSVDLPICHVVLSTWSVVLLICYCVILSHYGMAPIDLRCVHKRRPNGYLCTHQGCQRMLVLWFKTEVLACCFHDTKVILLT